MCRILGVSESGCHAWRKRLPSRRAQRDTEVRVAIRASHARSDATYGAPRILEDLREAGYRVGRKRVARLMRTDGLCGVSQRRGPARPRRTIPEAPRPRSRQTRLPRDRTQSALGRRHHLRADGRGLPLSRRRARCLQSAHRGLVDARHATHDRGPRCARHGGDAAARHPGDSPFRSRQSRWIQPVVATPGCATEFRWSFSASAGVFHPNVLRGLLFRASATA